MKSLRARIVVLSALMALGSAIICAMAATQVAQRNLRVMEERQAHEALMSLQERVKQIGNDLTFEAEQYAKSDELVAQMPTPTRDWAQRHLTPGRARGTLAQVIITSDGQRITGRFRHGDVRGAQPSIRDPASPSALAQLLSPAQPHAGLAILAGNPALYAVTPVKPSSGQGEIRGYLITLAYLTDHLHDYLQPHGWTLQLDIQHGATRDQAGSPIVWSEPHIARDGRNLRLACVITTHDGALQALLTTDRTAGRRIGDQTTLAILITGLCAAGIALLVGTWLGWRWLAPISALAKSCRQQLDDPQASLPSNSGLTEADLLSDSMHQLIMRLRIGQDELAHALDRESVTNAMHRRFLTQLGHEFGQPIRRIIALCEQMERRAGHLDPEEVAAAKTLAGELEQRFQEILSLVANEPSDALPNHPLDMREYLNGLADLMRPQATKAGITIQVDAPADAVQIDPALLSPILINLCANAIRAGNSGGTVWLSGRIDVLHGETWWTVKDNGRGLPEELATRLREAFTRGEVLPGTPGIGMGLTLALANARTLGGSLELHSQAQPGVEILLRLPLLDNSAKPTVTASERIRRRR